MYFEYSTSVIQHEYITYVDHYLFENLILKSV